MIPNVSEGSKARGSLLFLIRTSENAAGLSAADVEWIQRTPRSPGKWLPLLRAGRSWAQAWLCRFGGLTLPLHICSLRLFTMHFSMWDPYRNVLWYVRTLSPECSTYVYMFSSSSSKSFAFRIGSCAVEGNKRRKVVQERGLKS